MPYDPPADACTRTVIVHTFVAGIEPPVNLMPLLPDARAPPAVSVSVPPQLLVVVVSNKVMLPGAPAPVFGKKSVNVALFNAEDVGFVRVIVSVDTVLGATVLGIKDLLTDGAGVTVNVWLVDVFVPALLLDTAPAGIVFV